MIKGIIFDVDGTLLDSMHIWGECDKAKCCMEKGFEHCGQCAEMPCAKLKLLFGNPEHGDGGARLRNLQNRNNGNFIYEKLGNKAQEEAKKL